MAQKTKQVCLDLDEDQQSQVGHHFGVYSDFPPVKESSGVLGKDK